MNHPLRLASCPDWQPLTAADAAVKDVTQRVLAACDSLWHETERRSGERKPFPHLITLTPLADQELKVIGDPLTVVGKQLAPRGIDFYHAEPLPYRRVIVSFDELAEDRHLVLLITWCRFLRPGWYDGGGRFTHVVEPA